MVPGATQVCNVFSIVSAVGRNLVVTVQRPQQYYVSSHTRSVLTRGQEGLIDFATQCCQLGMYSGVNIA